MATTSNDIVKKPTKLKSYLRNVSVSASLLDEQDWADLAEFLVNLDFDVWQTFDDLEDLDRVLGDIEHVGRTELNEGIFRAHKSSSSKRAYARKWYQRRKGHLAARRRALKNSISAKAKAKKRERLRKQRKNVKGKPLKKYPAAKGHSNESKVTFAELVKPISEKYSVKQDYERKENPKYFIPQSKFKINDMEISAGQKFILIGKDMFSEIDGEKYKIDDPVPIIPYLKEIR
jgi:hypothetical protein